MAAAAGALIVVLAAVMLPPRLLLILAFAAWSLNMWRVDIGWLQLGPLVGLVLILAAILKQRSVFGVGPHKVPVVMLAPLAAAAFGVLFAPLALSPQSSLLGALAFLASTAAAIAAAVFLPGRMLARAAFWGLFPFVAASMVAILLNFPGAIGYQDRWYGMTNNSNALGLVLGAWVITARAYSPARMWLSLAVALPFFIGSGSRGAMLAMVAGLTATLWAAVSRGPRGFTRGLKQAAIIGVVVVAGYLGWQFASASQADNSLLRIDDSERVVRAVDGWQLALQNPWVGYGFAENSVGEVLGAHFTPVALAVRIGLIGVVIYAFAVIALLGTPWRVEPALAGVVFWGITSSFTEQWMFSSGTVIQAVFWMSVATLASGVLATQRKQAQPHQPRSHAGSGIPTNPRLTV